MAVVKPVTDPRRQESRRRFLRTAGVGGAALVFSLAGFWPVATRTRPRHRPPGALDEQDLLASCIKCGQCVQVCPVQALQVADLTDGFGVGVPYIDARAQACDFSCDVGQCILACPTGALTYHRPPFLAAAPGITLAATPVLHATRSQPEPTLILHERMGLARLVDRERCWSVLGRRVDGPARGPDFPGRKRWTEVDRWEPAPVADHGYALERCDLCVRECPVVGAISIEVVDGAPTPVVHEPCVGCGVCEMMCPAEPAVIVVEPRAGWGEEGRT